MADERFAGDMSRNEVEIDLNKFMELVQENSNLKAKIVEMEANREPDNPWQRWIFLSNMIDAWRIFPRAFLSVYIFPTNLSSFGVSVHAAMIEALMTNHGIT